MRYTILMAAGTALFTGCTISEDPSEGGFFSGVAAISEGTYDARVAEREQEVADAEARNAQLAATQQSFVAQIAAAESELAKLKFTLWQQKNSIGGLSIATTARIDSILNSNPTGGTNSLKLAALQKTIAEARALSAELAVLAG